MAEQEQAGGIPKSVSTLLQKRAERKDDSSTKVSVIGCGFVGIAIAAAVLTQDLSKNVVLVDMDEKKVAGEVMDFQHGAIYMGNAKISGGTDYALTKDSKVCVVTAGVRQQEGESRLGLVQRNVEVLKHIIPDLARNSPNCVFVIVSNPCDVLTYVAWKLSGFPVERVCGSGCDLDTSRFRMSLADKFKISSTSMHGYIIGEHGDSSVPCWSGVNVGGMFVRDIHPGIGSEGDPEKWGEIHKKVVNSAGDVIKLKGYTNWAIGFTVAHIVRSILNNDNGVHSLSTNVNGYHGIGGDVFLSLPCVLGAGGIYDVIIQDLAEDEKEKLQQSAQVLADIQKDIQF